MTQGMRVGDAADGSRLALDGLDGPPHGSADLRGVSVGCPRHLHDVLSDGASSSTAQIVMQAAPPFMITHVNAAWETVCGFEASEAIGQTCSILQGPDTSREALDILHQALTRQDRIRVRLLNYTKQGTPFLNDLSVEPLRSYDRSVTHFVGYLSPWQQPGEMLPVYPRVFETPEEDALTRDIKLRLPTSIEGVLEVDGLAQIVTERTPPFRITHVNDEWCQLCGFTMEESLGRTCGILQGPGTCQSTLKALHAAALSCTAITVKLLNFTKV